MEETEQVDKTTVEESRLAIAQANRDIQVFERYKRLAENDDFVEVIVKGFIQNYSTDLFQDLMDGTMSTKDEMENKMRKMEAIGAITDYVTNLHEKAQLAQSRIERENAFIARNGE